MFARNCTQEYSSLGTLEIKLGEALFSVKRALVFMNDSRSPASESSNWTERIKVIGSRSQVAIATGAAAGAMIAIYRGQV